MATPGPAYQSQGVSPASIGLSSAQQPVNLFSSSGITSISGGDSLAVSSGASWQRQPHQVIKTQASAHQVINGNASKITAAGSSPWPTSAPPVPSSQQGPGVDPFDVAWAAKSVNPTTPNPFGSKSVKKFEVQL